MKSVQIRSYFWSAFSYIRIEYGDLRSVLSLLDDVYWKRTLINFTKLMIRPENFPEESHFLIGAPQLFH